MLSTADRRVDDILGRPMLSTADEGVDDILGWPYAIYC